MNGGDPRGAPDASSAPGVPGLPLLGNAWGVARDPCRYFARCYAEFGPVFRLAYPGRTITVMAGLDANTFFAREGSRVFSAARTYRRVTRELGSATYPNAHDGEQHHELRKLLAPSLSAMAVEPFLPRIFQVIRERAGAWQAGSVSSVGARVSPLVADVVALCTTNRLAGQGLFRDINLWATLMGVVAVGGLAEFTLRLPPVRAARSRLVQFLREALQDHRTHPPGPDREADVLDSLLAAAARKPERLDEAALLALAMLPIKNAGIYLHRLVSFVLYELLSRQALLEAVTSEVDAAFRRGPPDLHELRQMAILHDVILETLRRYPMAIALPRVVAQPYKFAGFRFEAGDTVYIAGPVTHFDPTIFPDPETFDPGRYAPGRSEHRRPHAYAPFGLGPHACLARGYSQALAATVVAGLLRTVRMRLEPEGYTLRVRAIPIPVPEARFRFRLVEHRRSPVEPALAPPPRERRSAALWHVPPERQAAVFADLQHQTFAAGDTIFAQGDAPDRFYVVQHGQVDICREQPEGRPRVIARLGLGDHFGGTGLLQGVPRGATARASARTTVLALGREAFGALAVEGDLTRQEMAEAMGRQALVSGLARALPPLRGDALGRLAGTCEVRIFDAGEVILYQGEPASGFYVLIRGRVEIVVRPPVGSEFVVAHLHAVECFGEAGLLQRRQRTATIRAAGGPATVLEVRRERFEELLPGSPSPADDLARLAGERLLALVAGETR